MSLQFVFGNSGAGKSHWLYEHIIGESLKHPDHNYIILVPEQFTMQTQRELVLRHPRHGIMNIDVLSFARLAFRIFEETGTRTGTVLDDEGKNLILRKIAGDMAPSLKVLGGNIRKMGYISEVKSVLSELTQYSIGPEDMDQMLEAAGENQALVWKLKDIQKLYQAFEAYLEDKYITREELLDVMCRAAGRSEKLKNSTVALDGFTGFTPVQMKVLAELMRLCPKVMVTVTADGKTDLYRKGDSFELFAMSRKTVSGLVKRAKEAGIWLEPEVRLPERPVYRFRNNPALGFLESQLFRYERETWQGEQDALRICCARNPREEVRRTAWRIRHLVRERGYRYRDIAVIASDMEVYGDILEKEFASCRIPVFMDYKRNVLQNSFVEYIRSLLAMLDMGFAPDSVFRFLRTGLTGFSREELDMLENYVRALGIRGFKKWQEKWIRRGKNTTEEELETLNHLRVRFVEKLDSLVFVFRQRRKTVRDMTEALYHFFVQEDIQKQLKGQETLFQDRGELALAKEYAQIYRVVLELFDKFVALLGEEPMGMQEYSELLDAGFSEARVGVIPPGVDQVVAGDIERTRLRDIRALFLLGVNDTLIPGTAEAGGLLSDRDRERFAQAGVELAPGVREKTWIQKFYLYLNMTRPTEELTLLYSRVSTDGKSLRPAYLAGEVLRMYPDMKVEDLETSGIRQQELTPETGLACLAERMQTPGALQESDWQELYRWYTARPAWREKVERLTEAGTYRMPEDRLSRKTAEELFGNRRQGITRLEQFAACPFAHFLSYGLRLQEREEFSFAALDFGTVFHEALERYGRKLEAEGLDWDSVDEERQEALVEASVEESIVDYHNSVLYGTARNASLIPRMKRLLKRTVWAMGRQLARGSFRPEGSEVSFGSGKIDRIDTCEDEDKVYVKILDYKTGSRTFDMAAFYHGLQMQLTVYMGEALKLEEKRHPGKKAVPAGIFYYRMKDPLVEKKPDERQLEEAILRELKLDGIVNGEEAVIQRLDREFTGSSAVIPVTRTKSGYSRESRMVSTEEFQEMLEYAEEKREELEQAIKDGYVKASPYELGRDTACDYCRFRKICGFDQTLEGCRMRRLPRLSMEDVLGLLKIRKETGKWE